MFHQIDLKTMDSHEFSISFHIYVNSCRKQPSLITLSQLSLAR